MRVAVALVLLTGCYSPQPSPGAPCPDHVCPTGLVCSPATLTCELRAIDAGALDDAPLVIDAPVDGTPDVYVPPTPVVRQQAISYANQTASLSATLPSAPTSGNLLVMIGGTPTAPLTSVSGGGVTWQLAVKSTVQSNIEVWYGITNGSSATVTISLTNNNSPTWLSVSEWSNLTGSLDGARALDGLTSPASTTPVTTTTRDLLVFGVSQFTPTTFGTPTPGSWTALQAIDGSFVKQREWYRIEPTPGSYAASVTGANTGWDAALVAFKINP